MNKTSFSAPSKGESDFFNYREQVDKLIQKHLISPMNELDLHYGITFSKQPRCRGIYCQIRLALGNEVILSSRESADNALEAFHLCLRSMDITLRTLNRAANAHRAA